MLSAREEAAPAFVPVRVAQSAPACRVVLPNDVVVKVNDLAFAFDGQYCPQVRRCYDERRENERP